MRGLSGGHSRQALGLGGAAARVPAGPGEASTAARTLPFPPQASTEPIVTSGGSEVVPRVLPGEPQNLCACSLGHRAGREGLGLGDLQSLWWTRGPGPPWGGGRGAS